MCSIAAAVNACGQNASRSIAHYTLTWHANSEHINADASQLRRRCAWRWKDRRMAVFGFVTKALSLLNIHAVRDHDRNAVEVGRWRSLEQILCVHKRAEIAFCLYDKNNVKLTRPNSSCQAWTVSFWWHFQCPPLPCTFQWEQWSMWRLRTPTSRISARNNVALHYYCLSYHHLRVDVTSKAINDRGGEIQRCIEVGGHRLARIDDKHYFAAIGAYRYISLCKQRQTKSALRLVTVVDGNIVVIIGVIGQSLLISHWSFEIVLFENTWARWAYLFDTDSEYATLLELPVTFWYVCRQSDESHGIHGPSRTANIVAFCRRRVASTNGGGQQSAWFKWS